MVVAFANAPRATGFFHLALEVSARHVQAHRVTVNVLVGICGLDIFAACTYCNDEFNFMVQVFGQARVGDATRSTSLNRDDGIAWF